MDYMEFKNQMLEEIEERLTEKEYACYEPADGNMLEESLVIQEGNEPIRFGATTTSMYRAYKSGYSIKQIAEEIIREKDGHKEIKGLEKIRMLDDYERVKEDLYIRIVSTNKKVTVLERGIYRKIGDIILGVYLRINEDDGKLYTTLIDNTYLDKWELSKEDVLEQAMDNTVKMAPPRFYDGMQLKLSILTGRYGGIPIKEFSPTENERRYGCFLSTDKKTNGATAVFYPGVARKICEAYGTEAVYIVPTSIHEVAIHDIRYTEDVEMLSKCLEAVTEDSTPEDEVASSHIFMYELKTDKITEVM